MKYILMVLMGFAWAIGGEKYFGRWRRGVLISIVSVLIGLVIGVPWWGLLILASMFYIYQALFYDMGIKLIWPDPNTQQERNKILGWLILFCNGLICGLYPMAIQLFQCKWIMAGVALIGSGLGFCLISWLSNGLKWGWNGCTRIGDVKVWCPKDTWWWACWLYGIILGAVSII